MTTLHPDGYRPASVQRYQNAPLVPAHAAPDGPEQIVSFRHYLWLLRKNWWKIAAAVAVSMAIAAYISFRLTPIYESTARVAIDLKTPLTVVGEPTGETPSGADAELLFNTELQLIQSDAVLRPVANQFHLIPTKGSRAMPVGVKMDDTAVFLGALSVVHPANSYLINISYRSPDAVKAAEVANAVAHSYILRSMEMRAKSSMEQSAFMELQIGELKKNMDDSAASLAQYERRLGLIDPDEKTSILTARLLQLNTQYTDAQNDRIRKETDYQAFQGGSLAAVEVSPQATALARMEDAVHAAQEKLAVANTVYGPNYAEYKRAANEVNELTRQYKAMQGEIGKRIQIEYKESSDRENMIHSALLQTKSEADALNAQSIEYQELKRQAETNKSLYDELFRKVKEAGINGAFQGSAIRVADEARPQLIPVFPNRLVFISLAFLFSLVISVAAAIVADMIDKSLRDPVQAQRAMGLDVLGILPYVRQFQHSPSMLRATSGSELTLQSDGSDWFGTPSFYEESVNTLLSSTLIGGRGRPLKSILVTSAMSDEGKSMCIAHMAAAHARKGHRTLLIDADLRRPSQKRLFALGEHAGLGDAVLHNQPLDVIRQRIEGNEMLDVIAAGSAADGSYFRIGKKIQEILADARTEYDMIFIDAPPMLYFSEPLELAAMVDGVLLLSLAGQTNRDAVSVVLATLRRLGAHTLGIVLNQVKHNMSPSYQPYQSYYRRLNDRVLEQV